MSIDRATGVLFLHGGPGGHADELAPLEALLPPGCRPVRFDQRTEPPLTIEQFVADVEAVRLEHDLGRCAVIGHSWGAGLALYHSWTHPDAAGAVGYLSGTGIEWWPRFSDVHKAEQRVRLGPVLSARLDELRATSPRDTDDEAEYERLYLFSDMAPGPGAVEHVERFLASKAGSSTDRTVNAALNAEVRALAFDEQTEACARVRCPVVVGHGEHDPRPLAALTSMLAALPVSELLVLPDACHLPWLENPDATAAFLARVVELAR